MLKTNNLLYSLNFDGNLNDTSGNSNTFSSYNNGGTYVAGRFGNALTVTNSSSSYGNAVYKADLTTSTTSTFAGWFKLTDFIAYSMNYAVLPPGIFLFQNSPTGAFSHGVAVDTSTYKLRVMAHGSDASSSGAWNSGSTVLTAGTWYHIALTATLGGTATLYLNGNLELTWTAGSTALGTQCCMGDLRTGRYYGQGNYAVDSFCRYNKVLSQSDVKRVMLGLHPING